MTVDLVPILKDNYVFIIRGENRSATVVDPGEAANVSEFLARENLNLEAILITHHHSDHVGGVAELLGEKPSARVIGPRRDQGRWPFAFEGVGEGDIFSVSGFTGRVLETPGHTQDHVVYWFETAGAVFSGDVLFGLGCGRLFEGTPTEMFKSLSKLKTLPPETRVYCTHEYTEQNFAFVAAESPSTLASKDLADYEARMRTRRAHGEPTVPLILKDELRCNPLLAATTVEEFRDWRQRRDRF